MIGLSTRNSYSRRMQSIRVNYLCVYGLGSGSGGGGAGRGIGGFWEVCVAGGGGRHHIKSLTVWRQTTRQIVTRKVGGTFAHFVKQILKYGDKNTMLQHCLPDTFIKSHSARGCPISQARDGSNCLVKNFISTRDCVFQQKKAECGTVINVVFVQEFAGEIKGNQWTQKERSKSLCKQIQRNVLEVD